MKYTFRSGCLLLLLVPAVDWLARDAADAIGTFIKQGV